MSDAVETPTPAAEPFLGEREKAAIRADYARLREALPGFRVRAAQTRMIAAVARAFGRQNGAAAIEAPTGTGKSMAYLVPGLRLAQARKKTLIIATATVALQEQLVERDIPQALAALGEEAKVVLAKGRQRYACVRNLHELTGGGAGQSQLDLGEFTPVAGWARPPRPGEANLVKELAEDLVHGRWDGDLDRAPLPVESDTRALLTTSAGGCAGRRCAYIAHCPFFLARNRLREAGIIVANQDLVLADLLLGQDEDGSGGVLLPAPADSLYVFDEAHHLAAKAIDRGAAEVHLGEAQRRLRRLRNQLPAAYSLAGKETLGRLTASDIEETVAELEAGLEDMQRLLGLAWVPDPSEQEPRWRAPLGALPEDWRPQATALRDLSQRVARWLPAAIKAVTEDPMPGAANESLARELGIARERIEQQHALWWQWSLVDDADYPPTARWIDLGHDGGLVCHASAVSAAPLLRRVLWQQAGGAVLTSATLSAGGDFRALAAQAGLPDDAECLSLPSPFDLEAQAQLEVPAIAALPDDFDGHVAGIVDWLLAHLDWAAGNLVLFTSRRKLEAAYDKLPASRRPVVRAQGRKGKAELVAEHVRAIEAGRGSTLFGLASFGEGLDLPGKLCETVVITQLPFAVPTDPVEATFAEWLETRGRNPFIEVSVPNATRTLIQYCGRLIRNEADRGRIVILDRRLTARRYGAAMLRALPPFRRVIDGA